MNKMNKEQIRISVAAKKAVMELEKSIKLDLSVKKGGMNCHLLNRVKADHQISNMFNIPFYKRGIERALKYEVK